LSTDGLLRSRVRRAERSSGYPQQTRAVDKQLKARTLGEEDASAYEIVTPFKPRFVLSSWADNSADAPAVTSQTR
jgi:hypothetical protein